MHRFILRSFISICWIAASPSQAGSFSATEQLWIDAHPIVRFSIHEKYLSYLAPSNHSQEAGVFRSLLDKFAECTRQKFLPVWRKTDQEGLRQLSKGEVDFIIDPPTLTDEYLQYGQFGFLSDVIFWGQDAIVTKASSSLDLPNLKVGYFDRGFENPPHNIHAKNDGANLPTQ